jgi:hypothetical protein
MRIHVLALLLVARTAWADAADDLRAAEAHLSANEPQQAAHLAGPIAKDPHAAGADRAEAWRVYGLSLLALDLRDEAEAALWEYLKLEPDAHLDPALVPPETIVFFEDVRARHAGELRKLRPHTVRKKRYRALNLLPPWGQFQNHQPTKAWILGGVETALLVADVATYIYLVDHCRAGDLTCDSPGTARSVKTVNLVSGGLLLGTLLYGIIDGFVVYSRRSDEINVNVVATDQAAMVIYGGSF